MYASTATVARLTARSIRNGFSFKMVATVGFLPTHGPRAQRLDLQPGGRGESTTVRIWRVTPTMHPTIGPSARTYKRSTDGA
jgi:hypothetical protein